MGVLQKALIESLDGLPHLLLKASLEKKLAEQGCKDEELADKIASAILSADHSNKDIDLDVPFDIEFSEADNDDLQRQVDEFVSNMPTFIEEASKDFARGLLDALRVKWIKQSSERSSESDEMRQKIAHNWGDAFSDFKFLIEICSGYGDDFNHAYLKTRLKRDRLRNYTLSRLHIRACRIAGEIALLLDYGYTEGAQARWRTLLEVSVTALLISKGGDDLAQRYLDHEAIDKKRVLDDHDWAAKAGRLGGHINPAQRQEIESENARMIRRYGKAYRAMYGWAAGQLGICDQPQFHHLQEAAGALATKVEYRLACFGTHASPRKLTQPLHQWDRTLYIPGAFSPGFENPGVNSAYSLVQITSTLFDEPWDFDNLVKLQIISHLRDNVEEKMLSTVSSIARREQRRLRNAIRRTTSRKSVKG